MDKPPVSSDYPEPDLAQQIARIVKLDHILPEARHARIVAAAIRNQRRRINDQRQRLSEKPEE
jgi:hypothetical protein